MCCSLHSFSRQANSSFRHVDMSTVQVRHIALISCQVHIRFYIYSPHDKVSSSTSALLKLTLSRSACSGTIMARLLCKLWTLHFALLNTARHSKRSDICSRHSRAPQHSSNVPSGRCRVQVCCCGPFAAPCSRDCIRCFYANIYTC